MRRRIRFCHPLVGLLTAQLVISVATGARPPGADDVDELIILLAPGSAGGPRPEAVVNAVNEGGPIPGGLGQGNPHRAKLAITHRPTGSALAWLEDHPDTPQARLQRYVVFTYPEHVNVDAILIALSHNPNVEHVEKNLRFKLAVTSPSLSVLPSRSQRFCDLPGISKAGHGSRRLPAAGASVE